MYLVKFSDRNLINTHFDLIVTFFHPPRSTPVCSMVNAMATGRGGHLRSVYSAHAQ